MDKKNLVKESNVFDISTIRFDSTADASELISKLKALIKARGNVTVMDFLRLSDSECLSKTLKDVQYGWKSVDNAEVNVIRVFNISGILEARCFISLPIPVDLLEDGGDI